MSSPAGKILFISHQASRSGAPIVLLHLLKWIKVNTAQQFEILLLVDGPLRRDFELLAPTYVAGNLFNTYNITNRIRKKVLASPVNQVSKVAKKLFKNNYSLVYGNTILSVPWLIEFKKYGKLNTVCCVHELSFALNYCFANDYLKQSLPEVDKIVAVSVAVKQNLIASYQVPESQIELHYEFIDVDRNASGPPLSKTDHTFIIGAGGTAEWRKGTDLVVPLALKLAEKYAHFKFKITWLGADESSDYVKCVLYDAQKCGVTDRIYFVSATDKPFDVMAKFDVFALLSREDPFPLIALEAAYLAKPIVAFSNSGGIPELLNQGAGLLAPYLDLEVLADNIYSLANNTALYNQIASQGHQLIINRYNSNVVAPQIFNLLTQLA